MKHFLSESLIITLLVAAIFGMIYWQGHDYVQESNNLYKQRYIEQHGAEIKTLILGHSQAANGINPWVMGDSVFNMAEPSRILYYDKEILKRDIEFLPNLKVVLYPLLYQIDNGAFFTMESFRTFAIKEYKKAMNIAPPYEYRNYAIKPTIMEVLSKRNYVNQRDCDSLGYISVGNGYSDVADFINIEVCEDSIIAMLCTMAEICDGKDIRFIIVTEPCTNTFNEQVVDVEGIARINSIIDSVKTHYPVEYRNYLNHPCFRDGKLFHSQTHLNNQGATLFTKQIMEDFNL